MPDAKKNLNGSMSAYITGFILSVILTLLAYFMVTRTLLGGMALVLALMGLAVLQLYVQLVFFLHIAHESRPRWNLMVFGFMLMIVVIVVAGSLWIMNHLNYHMMTPDETDTYIIKDEGIPR